MTKTNKSAAMVSIDDSIKALHRVGAVNKITMHHVQRLTAANPTIGEYTSDRIRAIRTANNVSQPVFADLLNVSLSSVQKWESGAKEPSGAALMLLKIVERKGVEILAA